MTAKKSKMTIGLFEGGIPKSESQKREYALDIAIHLSKELANGGLAWKNIELISNQVYKYLYSKIA